MRNFKEARERAGLSQKEVAVELQVSAPTVSEWESGRKNPNAENLRQLSKLYNASTDYLLGISSNEHYVQPNENRIRSNRPISILAAQYHIGSDVFCSITGASRNRVDEWLSGDVINKDKHRKDDISEAEYKALSDFFEIPINDLKGGLLTLFPKESVQLKVLELTDIRFAAYGKEGEFSIAEIKEIKNFANLLKRARGSGGSE